MNAASTDDIKQVHDTGPDSPIVRNARRGERLSQGNEPDSFPEEGTDDKMVQHADTGAQPFSDDEALRATRTVIDLGLSCQGKPVQDKTGQDAADTGQEAAGKAPDGGAALSKN